MTDNNNGLECMGCGEKRLIECTNCDEQLGTCTCKNNTFQCVVCGKVIT